MERLFIALVLIVFSTTVSAETPAQYTHMTGMGSPGDVSAMSLTAKKGGA